MNILKARHDVAVVVGRWNIAHKGHETLFKTALASADKVVVVIGSAFGARDPRNPFTWEERAKMIEATLSQEDRARVAFLPVRDYHNNAKWNAAVRRGMESLVAPHSSTILVGFKKDWTSDYLQHMGWQLHSVEQEHKIDATDLRSVYFEANEVDAALSVMEPYVHGGVLSYLQAWSRLGVYAERAQEHRDIVQYKKDYPGGSYNTADSLVRVGDHVLLIQRKSKFGNGLWALPGGFLEPNERFLTAALRELKEETCFPMAEFSLMNALQGGPALFDNPLRSPRARLVTNAFYFRFGEMHQLPEVRPRDDAKKAEWVHIDDLPSYEGKAFEDHFVMWDHFLGIIKD